jgi:DNA-directed RNA polymerase subunit RPC12/RpoP
MNAHNEEDNEETVTEGEVLVGDPLLVAYRCTACYDEFTELELNGNTDDCPSCNEKEVIMEK